jgi:hypothetical protein
MFRTDVVEKDEMHISYPTYSFPRPMVCSIIEEKGFLFFAVN